MKMNRGFALVLFLLVATLLIPTAFAQETTAGVQGTVRDPQGLAVSKAMVEVTGPALIGAKKAESDSSGYYRLANLPVGEYTITVTAPNFKVSKLTGVKLVAGSLPTIDPKLEVGAIEQTVEVSGEAPIVDVTQSKVQTNVTSEELAGVPKGRSFQSVIPFAPGARQEPLQSRREDQNRGNGFQIDGASDSENVYMVEGLNTTDFQTGGVGRANVPFEFVQEVQIKSSSFEAEFGGALGGVVNVIQKRGGSAWHGSVFSYFRSDALNANDQCVTPGFTNTQCGLRLIPNTGSNTGTTTSGTGVPPLTANPVEYYQQAKDHTRTIEPGFEIGGSLLKDRLWLFSSYVPNISSIRRSVNFVNQANAANNGPRTFVRHDLTQNAMNRLDYRLTNNVRLFGSWQYAYFRNDGISMPSTPDSLAGQVNNAAGSDPTQFRPDTGSVNPSNILNFGGDYSVTSKFVVQARYGYFYTDSQDRGKPSGNRYIYSTSSVGITNLDGSTGTPASFQHTAGFSNISDNRGLSFDINKRKQFSTSASYFVGNLGGTHNFKFGYDRSAQANNVVNGYLGGVTLLNYGSGYSAGTSTGVSNCAAIINQNVTTYGAAAAASGCRGNYGYYNVSEGSQGVVTGGNASSTSHALYFQDAWTIKSLTINAGIRFDKEFLPPFSAGADSISFGFGDKIAPRIGVAYDVLHNGKMKAYFSYGKFFDIMKYSLPRGSFGGEYWHDCVFTLDSPDYTAIIPQLTSGHFCPAGPSTTLPTGTFPGRFIENQDFRLNVINAIDHGVDPNIKPMEQHEYVAGFDWAINSKIGFESRYSRKRLDNTIEDIGVTDALGFRIGNPGPGFGDLLHRPLPANGLATAYCPTCPIQPKAIRDYDAVEFRLVKRASDKWYGAISYTYSKLTGNYSGLTDSDVSDGNGGRHNPNNHRAFDAPQMQFDAHGHIIDGVLATDRPNTVKMFGFYRLKWLGQETLVGITQSLFQGTPLSTCLPTASSSSSCQFVEGRGNWLNLHRASNGSIVLDSISKGLRTPMFSQTDLALVHEVKVSKTHEGLRMGFEGNISNLLNQRAMLSTFYNPIFSGTVSPQDAGSLKFNFNAMMTGWDYMAVMNAPAGVGQSVSGPRTLDNRYGKGNVFQGGRQIRLKVKFVF